MSVVKTIPSKRIINGNVIETSEASLVSENHYSTDGESCIVVRGIDECVLTLNSMTTDHTVVKALSKVKILPDKGKIDEEYDEILLDKFACVEFRFVGGNWYILSSDGLKQS
jgi:hypothetical protein